jgi:hypothetical protein
MCRLSEPHVPPVSTLDAWRAFVQALRESVAAVLRARRRRAPGTSLPERGVNPRQVA